ncbi:transcriptional regulator, AraC family [Pseudomonas delhiensis]|uniref:Transcriptional regulator, AraC family n=1 Tax=Pseudomonas delhiensis TaxID=366289 RepID=A0A239N3W8_9PSED|nr:MULTISPECIES: helix-turn-helix domain-containing protein [Pseudomonas]MED5608334.1 helix-turn-helix domain-containing protein [Pseudomonas sp. JH-2]PWU26356.1 AraC family transcriptional regulator [Pseudomonas sp. RW407]SDK47200.1 transcriptional regulator, AraC family [Pseudomonas delhiensis]SNT48878.1 transcriptional regulator, AraC family [Pseudomonas delhiensis]
MHKTPASNPVPVFQLYGETHAWPTPDPLHCETIPSRSSLYDWEIRPHRHADLVQLLYVRAGEAELEVEGSVTHVREATLQVSPPLCVHGFRFTAQIDGYVISLAQPFAEELLRQFDRAVLEQPQCYAVGEDERYLSTLFESIEREYTRQEPGRELMLRSLVSALLVWLGRRHLQASHAASATPDRGREHLQAFRRLVEQRFREHLPIERYAERLGISAAHLNALCRRLAGASALQLINQRLLLEAKRNLVYTDMTVQEVSDQLGFSEPAYFSRFFKRGTGQSPRAFRGNR